MSELKKLGFKAFPKVIDAIKEGELAPIADNDDEAEEDIETGASSYDYLLGVSNAHCLILNVLLRRPRCPSGR